MYPAIDFVRLKAFSKGGFSALSDAYAAALLLRPDSTLLTLCDTKS
jgi:hypothetical protein